MKTLRRGLLSFALMSTFGMAYAQDQSAPSDAPPADAAPPASAPESADPSGSASTSAPVDSGSAPAVPTGPLFDNRFYIAPMGSFAIAPDSRQTNDGYGGRVALGKSLVPHLAVEVLGSYLHYSGKTRDEFIVNGVRSVGLNCVISTLCRKVSVREDSQKIYGGGLGANLYLSPSNHGIYIKGDAMGGNRFVYDGGLGFDLPIVTDGIGLRFEALYHKEKGFKYEPLLNLGVRIPLGKLPQPAPPPPEPVAVVPAEAPPAPPPPPPCEMPAAGQPISMEGCKTGDTIVLRGVNFDFNKSSLTANAQTLLDQVAEALTKRSDIKVEVDGHTDSVGSDAYNQKLSERRAASVKKYLVGKGIDAGRMTTKGFGETMPVADNKTTEGRDLNRRVELKVIDSGGSTDVPVSSGATDSSAAAAPAPAADAAPADAAPAP